MSRKTTFHGEVAGKTYGELISTMMDAIKSRVDAGSKAPVISGGVRFETEATAVEFEKVLHHPEVQTAMRAGELQSILAGDPQFVVIEREGMTVWIRLCDVLPGSDE